MCNSLARKLKNLGVGQSEQVNEFVQLVKRKRRIRHGEDIVKIGRPERVLTVLLRGVACRYKTMENGRRQIFTVQYPGDFCDYHRHFLPQRDVAVAALTDCVIGVILRDEVEEIAARHPQISLALWRNTMLEVSIFRERLLSVVHRPALERIASLLCEHIVRLEAIGIDDDIIPLTQIALADATGLSAVHVNRTIQDLREVGALSKRSHGLQVVSRDELLRIAKFDARYLDMRQMSSD